MMIAGVCVCVLGFFFKDLIADERLIIENGHKFQQRQQEKKPD